MKTLIIYATKYGATRTIAQNIAAKLGNTELYDIKRGIPSLHDYDSVILGGSIYMGHIQRKLTSFMNTYKKDLLSRKLGLFISCGTDEDTPGYMEQFFPEDIFAHACAVTMPGGLLQPDKMNFFARMIVKMVMKNKDATTTMTGTTINSERISEFVHQFSEAR